MRTNFKLKHLLSFLLCSLMLIGTLPTTVMAEDGPFVAYIGEQGYTTLEEAFNQAQNNDVIELRDDAVLRMQTESAPFRFRRERGSLCPDAINKLDSSEQKREMFFASSERG